MADKIFIDKRTVAEYISRNPVFPNEKPLIGFCPDWREATDENGNKYYFYMEKLLDMYRSVIENAGGLLYIIGFETKADDIKDIISGYLIPGGRDIDPLKYDPDHISKTSIHPEAELRYTHLSDMLENLPKKIPILGVCLGFQFLNVYYGGSLNKHIQNTDQHYKKRKFKITKGTKLSEITDSELIGNCYHHQNIDCLGANLMVSALDDNCLSIHAIELISDERWVVGILWHPESSYESEKGDYILEANQKIYTGFVKECIKRKLD